MSKRFLVRSALTAFLTAVVILAAGTFSNANAVGVQWIYAKCAQGELVGAQLDPDSDGGSLVLGSASFCLLQVLNSQFGVAVYKAGATAVNVASYNLRKYPTTVGQKRSFGAFVSGKNGTFGVCLVKDPNTKLSCAKIVFKNYAYVEYHQIAITDTLVNAKINGAEADVDPRCSACW
jgi:hypothetical protein